MSPAPALGTPSALGLQSSTPLRDSTWKWERAQLSVLFPLAQRPQGHPVSARAGFLLEGGITWSGAHSAPVRDPFTCDRHGGCSRLWAMGMTLQEARGGGDVDLDPDVTQRDPLPGVSV